MGESPDLAVPPPPPAPRGGRARAVTAAPAAGNLAKYGLGFGALARTLGLIGYVTCLRMRDESASG